jgi:glycerophosphoryl diester phosphodiesterase
MIMKTKHILLISMLVVQFGTAKAQLNAQIKQYRTALFDVQPKKALVCAHRGDWRNAPENSVQALKNCIDMGVAIMELDLKKSKDGHLIVLHDNTLDRTVKAKGKPEEYTLAELKHFWLKNATGHATKHTIPTLEEMMLVAKGKILINIDKGYEYFDDVIAVLNKTGTMEQAILSIKKNLPMDSLHATGKKLPKDLIIMPVLDISKKEAEQAMISYVNVPNVIIQLDFDQDHYPLLDKISYLKSKNIGIWFNSLWPELSGGHDDDKAVEGKMADETWGWLLKKGANVIQTDRPHALSQYLSN